MNSQDKTAELARMAQLGRLSAQLNHELRQPLFALRALAQLIEARGEGGVEIREMLTQMQRMQELVDSMSDLSREVQEGRLPLDPAESVCMAMRLMKHRALSREVKLELDRSTTHGLASGDRSGLTQVMVNLIQNAIDASEAGDTVLVELSSSDREVVIHVRDQGEGIPAELAEQIFKPYYTTKPPGEGTGLGLAICREILARAGGRLSLTPSESGGCFTVELRRWE